MTSEIYVDKERKILRRTISGELNTNRAIEFVQEIALAANLHKDFNILVDIRDTTFHPEMMDLLEIAVACTKNLLRFQARIAFVIPDTAQRIAVAKLFKSCMETQGFSFRQFFDPAEAVEWLAAKE